MQTSIHGNISYATYDILKVQELNRAEIYFFNPIAGKWNKVLSKQLLCQELSMIDQNSNCSLLFFLSIYITVD